ncbi:MAG: hypothetical protein ACI8RZ_002389 [Myxococcota bacterium]|jgi:hypothetical protein
MFRGLLIATLIGLSMPALAHPHTAVASDTEVTPEEAPSEADAMKREVKLKSDEVKACYEARLKHDRTLEGRLASDDADGSIYLPFALSAD